jgi:hypothetical protein
VRAVVISAGAALMLWGCSGTPSNAAGCVQGLSSSCMCADGRRGAQVCQPDNTFGQCTCSLAASLGGSAATGSGGMPVGGSAGTRAMGTGGNGSGAGGQGGGGAAGRFGGTGGQPTGGMGGAASPGGAYSFCNMSLPCAMSTTCTNPNGGYCSPACALALQCPRTSNGARATCVAGACAISSCDQLKCPRDTTCVQTSMTGTAGAPSFTCK